jgi:hypothetical protein
MVVQPLKNFPEFYGTRRFITAITRALQWPLSLARPIQSTPPHYISTRSIWISTHLHLGFPSDLFPSGFLTIHLYIFLFSPIRATCPTHLILDLIILIIVGEECNLRSSSLCSFSAFPSLHPSLVHIFSVPCSQIFCLCSFLKVRDQVSHPYRTTGNIIVLYILISTFLDNRQEDELISSLQLKAKRPWVLPGLPMSLILMTCLD